MGVGLSGGKFGEPQTGVIFFFILRKCLRPVRWAVPGILWNYRPLAPACEGEGAVEVP